jgi:hypothetical protein
MIGSDLILITEYDKGSPPSLVDYSDGSVFLSDISEGRVFDRDKRGELEDFASVSEGAKTFIELPVFGMERGAPKSISEVIRHARKNKIPILYDEKSKLHYFTDREENTTYFPSLEYIKAILDLVREYGFMGISFDIGRIPINFILAYNSLFKTIRGCRVNR